MLLALGILPDSREAAAFVQSLIGDVRMAYTIAQFCEQVGMGRSTYYRLRDNGTGPNVTLILGAPRITHEDGTAWLRKMGRPAPADKPLPRLDGAVPEDDALPPSVARLPGASAAKKVPRLSLRKTLAGKGKKPLSSADPPPVPAKRRSAPK